MKNKYDDHLLRELGYSLEESGDERVLRYRLKAPETGVNFTILIDGWLGAVSIQADDVGLVPMSFPDAKAVAALLESMEETA